MMHRKALTIMKVQPNGIICTSTKAMSAEWYQCCHKQDANLIENKMRWQNIIIDGYNTSLDDGKGNIATKMVTNIYLGNCNKQLCAPKE